MALQCTHYNTLRDITYIAPAFRTYLIPSFHMTSIQFVIVFFIASDCYSITLCKILFCIFFVDPPHYMQGVQRLLLSVMLIDIAPKSTNQYLVKDTRSLNCFEIT